MSENKISPEPSMDEILASIRRILAEDDHVAMRPRTRLTDDVLDLTEALNDDGSVRHIAPVALVSPEAMPRVLPDGRVEPTAPRPDAAAAEPQLVSPAASEAVAASFARLAEIRRGEDIEEAVRDALRPMLQAWLDAHLPDLVERLVRTEIARVVGGTRPAAP